jgi:hypothetical protein
MTSQCVYFCLASHLINTKHEAFRPLPDPSLGLWEWDMSREGRGEWNREVEMDVGG